MTERKYFGERPIHPGALIRERFIIPSGKKPAELCRNDVGISESQMSRVLNGKANVTADVARSLGHIFDVSPMIFLELQNRYDLAVAEEAAKQRARDALLGKEGAA
jgi:antitoxin HigA-1